MPASGMPRLNPRQQPWISLTDAAVFLSPRAAKFHKWKGPFELLARWVESGEIKVYEAQTPPFVPIPKAKFFGVPFKYPSYPEIGVMDAEEAEAWAQLAELRKQLGQPVTKPSLEPDLHPGKHTFIDCSLHRRDRYFAKGSSEPRWRDLRIQSEELLAILAAANVKATADIMKKFPPPPPRGRGRPPKINFDVIETEIFNLMNERGEFSDDNPKWNNKARLEEAVFDFIQRTWGENMSESRVRDYVNLALDHYRSRKIF
jgi:hypothetical protein